MNRPTDVPNVRVALIGTGQVARALAARIDHRRRFRHDPVHGLGLAQACNARGGERPREPAWTSALARLAALPRRAGVDVAPRIDDDVDLVIDLSASDAVAASHAQWLARGLSVITANKRGLGESAARAEAILAAAADPFAYGDSATVGAGLGGVRRLRELTACGERVFAIAGVLSGTLAWLFERYDGRRPFSDLVREAHALGFTEPDPRQDVGGADVARKLRILARAVGWPVPDGAVQLDPRLRCPDDGDPWRALVGLDAGMAELLDARPDPSAKPAVVARAERPELTAAAVLEDALNAVSQCSWRSARAA